MNCEQCREELSARLDGEPALLDSAAVDEHLAECADCATWQHRAATISRSIRVRPASSTPDLTAAILAAAASRNTADRPGLASARSAVQSHSPSPGESHTPAGSRSQEASDSPAEIPGVATRQHGIRGGGETWRWALGLIALIQLSLGLAQLLGVSDMGHMVAADSEHLFNESTAWNIALGMGFAVAAVWPKLAGGLLPTLGVFVAVLTVVSVIDLANGDVEFSRVASHLVVVVGMAVLLVVHREFDRQPGPVRAEPDDASGWVDEPMPDRRTDGGAPRGRGGLRPAGRHAA